MFSPQIEWNRAECGSVPTNREKYCTDCDSILTWTCTGSGRSGLYTNYYRHRDNCSYIVHQNLKKKNKNKWERSKLLFSNAFKL